MCAAALPFRRTLRRNATEAEKLLWRHLRAHRFAAFKFRRQHPYGPYVLDFYCPSARLAIELDGGQHFESVELIYDRARTAFLEERGIRVLRFQNDVLMRETEAVLEELARVLTPAPSP